MFSNSGSGKKPPQQVSFRGSVPVLLPLKLTAVLKEMVQVGKCIADMPSLRPHSTTGYPIPELGADCCSSHRQIVPSKAPRNTPPCPMSVSAAAQLTAPSSSTSPFWKPPSQRERERETPKSSGRESGIVVGASYSHADMLRLESLFVPPHLSVTVPKSPSTNLPRNVSGPSSKPSSRPRTPPAASNKLRPGSAASSPQARRSSGRASPPFKHYINFLSTTNDDWKADEDEMGEYEDEDGDDFGLPSVSNMKRRKRKTAGQSAAAGALGGQSSPGLDSPKGFHSRRYSDSADIAIERPTPSYPTPKKSEGKILRPQYKEILRGASKFGTSYVEEHR